jgi:hypothetical protein
LLERATTSQEFDLEDQDPEGPDLEDPNSNRRLLHDLYRTGFFTYGVFLTDGDGIVQLVEPDSLQFGGADLSTYACIRAALQTGQLQASDLITSTAIPKPFLAFVVPVKDEAGTVVGLIGGATDPTSPLAGFLPALEGGGGGEYVQVVDANGLVIAHSEGAHLLQTAEHADVLLTLMREKQPGIVTRDVEEEGRGRFAEVIAFFPSQIAPWGVFAEQPKARVLAPVYGLRQRLILIGVVTLLATIVVTWLTTQAVVVPLRELLAASRRIHASTPAI